MLFLVASAKNYSCSVTKINQHDSGKRGQLAPERVEAKDVGLRDFLPKVELMNRANSYTKLKENVGHRINVLITRINEETNDLILIEKETWTLVLESLGYLTLQVFCLFCRGRTWLRVPSYPLPHQGILSSFTLLLEYMLCCHMIIKVHRRP